MSKIRVLLADDHAIMRIGLSSLLSREKDIADQMNVSLITVKKLFSDIFVRLGVSNRAEAIATALNKHLLKTELPSAPAARQQTFTRRIAVSK